MYQIEGRIAHENIKKVERENVELRKALDLKSDLLEKYKEENTEMSAVINSDKFKSIKTIEVITRQLADRLDNDFRES